ncbi:MAG: histidine phosphatase family protein [Planctomycetes bacterium]|nr:histidine phosphatase family protein [Planctomycetota bacterium]
MTLLIAYGAILAGAASAAEPAEPATSAAATPTIIYIVRHAEPDVGPPQDPFLSKAGEKRAYDLQQALRSAGLAAIYHTEARRTRQTVRALAGLLEIVPRMTGAPEVDRLVERLKTEHRGQSVLVVGHSDTIPAILKGLGVGEDRVPTIGAHEYDHLFVVVIPPGGEPSLIHLHYGTRTSR